MDRQSTARHAFLRQPQEHPTFLVQKVAPATIIYARVFPADEETDLAVSALVADAIFFPEKLTKKSVSTMLNVPELPNAFTTQLRPR